MIKSTLSNNPKRFQKMFHVEPFRTLDILTIQAVVEEPFLFSKHVMAHFLSPWQARTCVRRITAVVSSCVFTVGTESAPVPALTALWMKTAAAAGIMPDTCCTQSAPSWRACTYRMRRTSTLPSSLSRTQNTWRTW